MSISVTNLDNPFYSHLQLHPFPSLPEENEQPWLIILLIVYSIWFYPGFSVLAFSSTLIDYLSHSFLIHIFRLCLLETGLVGEPSALGTVLSSGCIFQHVPHPCPNPATGVWQRVDIWYWTPVSQSLIDHWPNRFFFDSLFLYHLNRLLFIVATFNGFLLLLTQMLWQDHYSPQVSTLFLLPSLSLLNFSKKIDDL